MQLPDYWAERIMGVLLAVFIAVCLAAFAAFTVQTLTHEHTADCEAFGG